MSKTINLLEEIPPGAVVWTERNDVYNNKQPVYGTALSRQWAALHAPFTMEQVAGSDDRYRILNNQGLHYFVWSAAGDWSREQAELIVERSNAAAAIHLMTRP